jgi:hypothetical protein
MIFAPFAFRNQVRVVAAPANPTLTINWTELYLGGAVEVYKNGTYYGSPTAGTPFIVPIVAGDTFYVDIIPAFEGSASYNYYVNEVFITSGFSSAPTTLTTATYTASSNNAYRFDCTTEFGS